MIVSCNCGKYQFLVKKSDIPSNGRNVQCGVCGEKWFYGLKTSTTSKTKSTLAPKVSSNWFSKLIILLIFLTSLAGAMNLLKGYILINIPELKIYYILIDSIIFELKNFIQSLNI
jgi:predicted Zn finger-like uncharacterized protein